MFSCKELKLIDVSRTPVREAIRILELEDLIVVVPRRGKFVAGIRSKREINEIFQVREELEGLAAYLAARRIKQDQVRKLKNYAEEIQTCIDNDDLGLYFHYIMLGE